MSSHARIAVYAATGFLGRLVTSELQSMGCRLRLGGRDAVKLQRLAQATGADVEWMAADVEDEGALRRLLAGCGVVVNCAGALSGLGDRLVTAAIAAGAHYVDAAGEQPFIRQIFERHGEAASRRGSALVPAFGLDYALGDCLAAVVARGHQPAREVLVAYAIEGADVSANSLKFAGQAPLGHEVLFESGAWRKPRTEIYRRTVTFPAPFGPQPMARLAAGEIVTIPRHVRTDTVTALIIARALVPHPRLVPFFPYLRPLIALVRRTPLRHLLTLVPRVQALASAKADTVPTPPRFSIVVDVLGKDGSKARGIVEGTDFHRVTARTLAFGARRLASPDFRLSGALAPASVVTPESLFADLAGLGVSWRIEEPGATR